jgi:hypothetical protein
VGCQPEDNAIEGDPGFDRTRSKKIVLLRQQGFLRLTAPIRLTKLCAGGMDLSGSSNAIEEHRR